MERRGLHAAAGTPSEGSRGSLQRLGEVGTSGCLTGLEGRTEVPVWLTPDQPRQGLTHVQL
ncbi:hypothetical protein MC885_018402 [Smutsia gigantea]|nr:hypothetical protein MC885_018402 [Smutsia gigantea]